MSSSRDQPGYPAVPSSLNPNDHELRDYYQDQSVPANTTPQYTPYLGLQARLSQVWINRWTILLALIICRLLLAIKDIKYDIANAKEEALSACTSVENVGSAMASMPHYLSTGVNALAADGVTAAINGLMDMLMLTITAVEQIVLFVINMMTSTYTCLITLAITSNLETAITMITKAGNFMNETIGNITIGMVSDLTSFQSTLNGFLTDLNFGGLLGSTKKPPTINFTSQIDELNNIKIDPTTMDTDLTKLNNSIPTFADVQNFTNTVISFPFEELKKLINESVAAYTFDSSIFPVAQKQQLTFCSDNPAIENFFGGLVKVIMDARKIFIVVLTLLAILVCIPMAYFEIWRWRTMQQRAKLVQGHSFDGMDVIYIASRPYTSTAGIKTAAKFKSSKRQILVRWFFAYATSLPALFVLALGLAGLLSCLCQYIVLKTIEKEVPILADEVGDFASIVVQALNNASEAWAISANDVINSTNTKINDEVFGWVLTSTSAINGTLNAFQGNMTSVLNETLGGTIFSSRIDGIIRCLIDLKIASFEQGLTWVHDHAHVTFPEFRPDVFSLGAAASLTNSSSDDSFLASPGSVASDDITSAIAKVALKLQDAIRQEAIISACVCLIWVLIMLIGLVRVLFAMLSRDRTRGEGGAVGYTGDKCDPFATPRSPNRKDMTVFPDFGPVSSVHPQYSSDDMYAQTQEKIGHGGHRSVEASLEPGHERSSSYGYVEK